MGHPRDPLTDPTRLVVGRIRSLHGLRGVVRVEVLTDRPEVRFAAGSALYLEGSDRRLTVASASPVADGPGWWLSFRELRSRAAAEPLRDAFLEVEVDRTADLGAGQAYWHEVVGAEVLDRSGRSLGRVTDIYRAGEAEVYVVAGGPSGPFDLPAVQGIVVEFAPERGEIVVDEAALDLVGPPPDSESKRARKPHRWSRHGKGSRDGGAAAAEAAPGGPAIADPPAADPPLGQPDGSTDATSRVDGRREEA
ncbi:MAG TPA: ribosome maturation factor RimM [Candidatus Limnocylindrales bacterium]|nr:ribosome maturation factor RimM [Candidatus Limnocylindrales bacterium]